MHFQIELQHLWLTANHGQIAQIRGTAAMFDEVMTDRLRLEIRAWVQKQWAGTPAPGWRNTLKRTGAAFFIEGSTLDILPAQAPTSSSTGEALLFRLQTPIKTLNLLVYGNEQGQLVLFPKLDQDQEGILKEALHRGAQILLNLLQIRLASYGFETQIKFEADRYTLIPRMLRLSGKHWKQLTGQDLPADNTQAQLSFTPAKIQCWIQDQKLHFEVQNVALHLQGNPFSFSQVNLQVNLNHASIRGDFDPEGKLNQLDIQHITGHLETHLAPPKSLQQPVSATDLDLYTPSDPWLESPLKLKPLLEALGFAQDPLEMVGDLLSIQPYHAWITDLKRLTLYVQRNPSMPVHLSFQGGNPEGQRTQQHVAQGISLENVRIETRVEFKHDPDHHQYMQARVQCDAFSLQATGFSLKGLQSHFSLDSKHSKNHRPPQILSLRLRGHFHNLHGDRTGILATPTPQTTAVESEPICIALKGEIHAPDLASPTTLNATLTGPTAHWNATGLSVENFHLQADFKETHRQTQLAGSGKRFEVGFPATQGSQHLSLQAAQLQQFEMHSGPLRLELSGQNIAFSHAPHHPQFNVKLHWHLHHHNNQIRTRIQGLSHLQQNQAPPAPLKKNIHDDLHGKIKLTPTAFLDLLKRLNLSTVAQILDAEQILKNETLQLKIDVPTAYAERHGEPLAYVLVARIPDLETRYGAAQIHLHHHPIETQIHCKLTPNPSLTRRLGQHIEKESQGVVEYIAFENGRLRLSLDLPQILAWVSVSIRCEGKHLRMSIHDARFLGLLQVTLTARESIISALKKYGAYGEGQDILIPVDRLLQTLFQQYSRSLENISEVNVDLAMDSHRQHHITLSFRHQA